MPESLKKSIDWGREVVRIEAEAVKALYDRIDDSFARAVDMACQRDPRIAGRLPSTKGKL